MRLHHKLAGDDGPAVVLLHHFYGNVWSWRHVMDAMEERARLLAFDRPAFGLTERPDPDGDHGHAPYTRAFSVAATVGLMDHHGIDEAVLVGASAGGTIALRAALEHPDRVRGLVLVSAAVGGDVGPPGGLRPLLRTGPARRLGAPLMRRLAGPITPERVGRSWHDGSRASGADVETYRRPTRVPGWEQALWAAVTAERPPNLWPHLGGVGAPALVVVGDSDRVVRPRWNRRLAERLPEARFAMIDACGHVPHEERPDALIDHLDRFLDRLG